MKNRSGLKFAILTSVVLGVTGCATGYQSKGFSGGYEDTQIGSDVYRVNFEGNGYTKNNRVQDFLLLRASQIEIAFLLKSASK